MGRDGVTVRWPWAILALNRRRNAGIICPLAALKPWAAKFCSGPIGN